MSNKGGAKTRRVSLGEKRLSLIQLPTILRGRGERVAELMIAAPRQAIRQIRSRLELVVH